MRFSTITFGVLMLAAATPAMAQDEEAPPVTVTGGVTGITDYRFRGISQTDENIAVQGTLNINHESGFYAGTFVSTVDGTTALPGYGNLEVDLYAGYTKTFEGGFGLDVGLLYYVYPDAASGPPPTHVDTDFFEPYASLIYTAGPVTAKVGANWAWSGQSGLAGNDNIYIRGDLTVAVPGTPISLLGHAGYTDGQLGILSPDGNYIDWSLGAEAVYSFVKVGVQYVDTDIKGPVGYSNAIGADSTILGYVSFSF